MKNSISKNYLQKISLSFKSIEDISDEIVKASNICLKSINKKKKNYFLWQWWFCG